MVEKQARNWLLTLPEESYPSDAVMTALDFFPRFIGQLEEGKETGYRHWQVYAEADSSIRFTTIKKRLPKAHIEARSGSKTQAIAYCTKADTRVPGVEMLSKGGLAEPTPKVTYQFLHDQVKHGANVDELILEHPTASMFSRRLREVEALVMKKKARGIRSVSVFYLYGPAGCGKTSTVLGMYEPGEVYRVTDYQHPFDEYRGEKVLVLDEFNSSLNLSLLLNVLDVYPLSLPARYENRAALYTQVWVISNKPLEHQYVEECLEADELRRALVRRFQHVWHFDLLKSTI